MSDIKKPIISDEDLIEKKQTKEDKPRVYLKGSKRLLAAFFSMLIILTLGLLLDKFVIAPIAKNVTNYNQITEKYKGFVGDFEDIQDEYGIFTYTKDNQRIPNENVTEETKEQFLKDPRIVELNRSMNNLEKQLWAIDINIIAIDYVVSTLIYSLVGNFLFGVGRSFSAFVLHYELVDENDKKLRVGKVFKYSLLKWLFNAILGLATLGILPLYNLYSLSHDENKQSPVDKLIKVKYRVKEKYSSDQK